MFTLFLFSVAGMLYGFAAWVYYHPTVKNQSWVPWVFVVLAIVTNLAWLKIARDTSSQTRMLVLAMCWDTMITLASIIVPIVFYEARLSAMSWLGVLLVVVGLALLKSHL